MKYFISLCLVAVATSAFAIKPRFEFDGQQKEFLVQMANHQNDMAYGVFAIQRYQGISEITKDEEKYKLLDFKKFVSSTHKGCSVNEDNLICGPTIFTLLNFQKTAMLTITYDVNQSLYRPLMPRITMEVTVLSKKETE